MWPPSLSSLRGRPEVSQTAFISVPDGSFVLSQLTHTPPGWPQAGKTISSPLLRYFRGILARGRTLSWVATSECLGFWRAVPALVCSDVLEHPLSLPTWGLSWGFCHWVYVLRACPSISLLTDLQHESSEEGAALWARMSQMVLLRAFYPACPGGRVTIHREDTPSHIHDTSNINWAFQCACIIWSIFSYHIFFMSYPYGELTDVFKVEAGLRRDWLRNPHHATLCHVLQ